MFRVATDVVVDERAERDDPKAACACVIEHSGDQSRAEAAPLAFVVDFGVEQGEDVVAAFSVDKLACVLAFDE